MSRSEYNATVLITRFGPEDDAADEMVVSMCVGAVDEDGYLVRSNASQFTGLEESRAYHEHFLGIQEARHGGTGFGMYFVPGTRYFAENCMSSDRSVPYDIAVEPVFWRTEQLGTRNAAVAS